METTSVRVTQSLYKQAKLREKSTKRKAPKQIEYWAEIGKLIEERINPEDLEALKQGRVQLRIENKIQASLTMRDILQPAPLEKKSGEWFQASQDIPGCLVRISTNGQRELGNFADGKFIPLAAAKTK